MMQMFLIGILLMYLYYYSTRIIGLGILIFFWIVSYIGPFLVAYENKYYYNVLGADNRDYMTRFYI